MKDTVLPIGRSFATTGQEEDEILSRVAAHPAAFEQIYERYLTRIYRYVYARVGNTAAAEDITSQIFLAAYESLPRYRHQGQFAAWLFSIARAKVADFYRKEPPPGAGRRWMKTWR